MAPAGKNKGLLRSGGRRIALFVAVCAGVVSYLLLNNREGNSGDLPKEPRYIMSRAAAEAMLRQIVGPDVQLEYECVRPPYGSSDPLFWTHVFNIPSLGVKYNFKGISGELWSYRDWNRTRAYQAFVSKHGRRDWKDVSEHDKLIAVRRAQDLLARLMPEFDAGRLRPIFSLGTSIEFCEFFPSGASNWCYRAQVALDASMEPFFAAFTSRFNQPKVSTSPQIEKSEAINLACEKVRNVFNAVSTRLAPEQERPEREREWLRSIGAGFGLRRDDFGVQRLTYMFEIKVQGKTLDNIDKEYVEVDAHDGEVLPGFPPVLPRPKDEILIRYGINVFCYLDGFELWLYRMPQLHDGEPYIYIGYLDGTSLWPGKVYNDEKGYTQIAYGDRKAVLSGEQTSVFAGERKVYEGKAPLMYKGKPYIHYKAVAALTGDQLEWNPKRHRLYIKTIPPDN